MIHFIYIYIEEKLSVGLAMCHICLRSADVRSQIELSHKRDRELL